MATADLTVLGLGRPDPSAGAYIAAIQRRLSEQDKVGYKMHAMGTSLEGSTADILAVAGDLHAVPFELGLPRVYTVLKLDERRDRPEQTLEDKVASVERRLAEDAGDAASAAGGDPAEAATGGADPSTAGSDPAEAAGSGAGLTAAGDDPAEAPDGGAIG